MAKFEPSEQSFDAGNIARLRLQQLRTIVDGLDLPPDKELPPWVQVQVSQALNSVALVSSFIANRKKPAVKASAKKGLNLKKKV